MKPRFDPADLSWDRNLALCPRSDDGRPLLGRIPILCRIARGGMGTVYYAIHPRLDVEVAVKVLPFQMIEDDPELAKRFTLEAKLAATARSDHLVQVLDVDEERGTLFIVMEYVPGVSAAHRLKQHLVEHQKPMPEAEALRIMTAATRGLAVAHEKGIIHRDVKPDNILIPDEVPDRAKLADLGLARRYTEHGLFQEAKSVIGTPGFMAPEQAMNPENACTESDVFSIGSSLYALITGSLPYPADTTTMILMKTINDEVDPMPEDVSNATQDLVFRCLSKYPNERPTDAAQLLMALESL